PLLTRSAPSSTVTPRSADPAGTPAAPSAAGAGTTARAAPTETSKICAAITASPSSPPSPNGSRNGAPSKPHTPGRRIPTCSSTTRRWPSPATLTCSDTSQTGSSSRLHTSSPIPSRTATRTVLIPRSGFASPSSRKCRSNAFGPRRDRPDPRAQPGGPHLRRYRRHPRRRRHDARGTHQEECAMRPTSMQLLDLVVYGSDEDAAWAAEVMVRGGFTVETTTDLREYGREARERKAADR